jgi:hypothetical protein
MEVESRQEGADARAGAKDATDEATAHARPAAAAPRRPEASVAAIMEAVRVRGERAAAEGECADAEEPPTCCGCFKIESKL